MVEGRPAGRPACQLAGFSAYFPKGRPRRRAAVAVALAVSHKTRAKRASGYFFPPPLEKGRETALHTRLRS